jgi:hypothetical protein
MKWKTALYDALSLVLLDRHFQRDSDLAAKMPGILAIEESFLACHMRAETAERIRPHTEILLLPEAATISEVLKEASLPASIAQIDRLVFAAAVHYEVAVITGDERLVAALRASRMAVSHIAAHLEMPSCRKVETIP